jgi:hypothetical protein
MIKTTTISLKAHQEGISISHLPKTFQDTILYVRKLGLRWLWIDSLCIVQDDISDWYGQTSRMAEIYTGAFLTIAASGSADGHGGLFKQADTLYQHTECNITDTQGRNYDFYTRWALPHCRTWEHLRAKGLPLFQRGWTFQERLLSPRVLHFTSNEVVWECKEGYLCECSPEISAVPLSSNSPLHLTRWSMDNQLPKPLFWMMIASNEDSYPRADWISLATRFSGLNLTFQDDKLPAISGIARIIEQRFKDTYLAGMWRTQLPYTLCWSRSLHAQSQQSQLRQSEDARTWRAPTWSWASRDGQVHFTKGALKGYKVSNVIFANCSQAGSDRTGRVEAGFLVMIGTLWPLNYAGPSSSVEFDNANAVQFERTFMPDNLAEKKQILSSGSLYLFPVVQVPSGRGWTECLILKETNRVYQDVSHLDISWLEQQPQKMPGFKLEPRVFERVGFYQLDEGRDCDMSPFLDAAIMRLKTMFVFV